MTCVCGTAFTPARRGRPRLYCSDPCKLRSRDRSRERRANRVGGANHAHVIAYNRLWRHAHPVRALPPVEVPYFETGDALMAEAVELARYRPIGAEWDAEDRDVVQDVVLALLEGRDPETARKSARRAIHQARLFVRSEWAA